MNGLNTINEGLDRLGAVLVVVLQKADGLLLPRAQFVRLHRRAGPSVEAESA